MVSVRRAGGLPWVGNCGDKVAWRRTAGQLVTTVAFLLFRRNGPHKQPRKNIEVSQLDTNEIPLIDQD